MNILVTGTNRGLGKYIAHQYYNCSKFTRDTNLQEYQDHIFDLIIHCAANVSHYDWDNAPAQFFDDNINLTNSLVNLNASKFVYISSIDQKKNSPYGISKRISECIVRDKCDDYLILRPSGLLGKEMKKNTFQKILSNESIVLTEDSVMNYTTYEDVLNVIQNGKSGTINLCANEDITMKHLVKVLDKDVNFGHMYFNIESVKSDYDIKKTSEDNVLQFVRLLNEE